MEKRNESIDLLKTIAVIGVIAIHAKTFKGIGGSFEILYSVIETIARISVPIFFFFNGYYFYKGYKMKGNIYYKNFCIKIIKIHIIAGIVYKVFIIINNFILNKKIELAVFDYKKILIEFMYRGFYFHLWYLPVAIILTTILVLFIKLKKVELLLKISIIMYSFGVLCNEHFLDKILNSDIIKYGGNGISLGMIFVTLGYLYSQNSESVKKYFKFSGVWLIALLLIERLTIYLLTGNKEVVTMYFMLIPITIYLTDYFINKKILIENKIILKYGKESIGIYLYHYLGIIIIIEFFEYINITTQNIMYHILLLVLSYMFAYYIYKIQVILIKIAKLVKRNNNIIFINN